MDGFKTALILSDLHTPEQDQKAVDLVYKIASTRKLDRVISLGDLADFYQISKYDKDPSRAFGEKLQEELDIAEALIERFSNLAPFTLIDSNHADRLEKYLKIHAPGLFGLRSLSIKNLLNLSKYGADTSGPLFLGNLLVMHGHEYKGSGKYAGDAVKKVMEKTGNSVMMGHVHKMAHVNIRKRSFAMEGYEMGCLCNFENDYCLDPDWDLCFGFVDYRDAGDKAYYVEQVKITTFGKSNAGRRAFYRGKIYEIE